MWKVGLWAQLLLLVGCAGSPQLCDYYDPHDLQSRRDFQIMDASPIVVVGTVRSVQLLSKGVRARKQPSMLLDLEKASIEVENSLRGGLVGPVLEFYYFEFSAAN